MLRYCALDASRNVFNVLKPQTWYSVDVQYVFRLFNNFYWMRQCKLQWMCAMILFYHYRSFFWFSLFLSLSFHSLVFISLLSVRTIHKSRVLLYFRFILLIRKHYNKTVSVCLRICTRACVCFVFLHLKKWISHFWK